MKHLPLLLVAAIFAGLANGCRQASPSRPQDAGAVKTDVPAKKAMHYVIEQPASIEAFEEAPLVARIPGYVAKVESDIGDDVKRGKVLAELSVPEMIKEHAQKTAMIKQAQAEVEQAKALVGEADAAIVRASSNCKRWESEYTRVDGLYRSKVVEKQIVDETLYQLEAAKAARLEAGAKLNKAKADVAVAAAHVEVARSEEDRLKALIEYRYIRAPFDGVVTRRNVHAGHFLQPNASGGPGALFVVMRIDILRIVCEIPETEAVYITRKLTPRIHVPALKGEPLTGEVARTSRSLDPKARTLRVEIDHINTDRLLRPGMFANVAFSVDLGERFTLPAGAIFTYADEPCCWRVLEGKAVRTPLKVGARDGQLIEVLKMKNGPAWQPVTGAEEVVVTNLGAISEGREVRVKQP